MLDRTNNEVLEALLGDPERGTPGILPWKLPVEVGALATHRAAAIIRAGSGGTLEAAMALETDDVRALADAIDATLPALVDPDAALFNGVPISAMRTASVPVPSPLLSKDGTANLAQRRHHRPRRPRQDHPRRPAPPAVGHVPRRPSSTSSPAASTG
jgi:hypothetical protein